LGFCFFFLERGGGEFFSRGASVRPGDFGESTRVLSERKDCRELAPEKLPAVAGRMPGRQGRGPRLDLSQASSGEGPKGSGGRRGEEFFLPVSKGRPGGKTERGPVLGGDQLRSATGGAEAEKWGGRDRLGPIPLGATGHRGQVPFRCVYLLEVHFRRLPGGANLPRLAAGPKTQWGGPRGGPPANTRGGRKGSLGFF